jgi:hypothetical protein
MNDNKKTVDGQQNRPLMDLDSFWLETGRDGVREALSKQEGASKQIISITSALQAIYFATLSFSDLKKVLLTQNIHGGLLIIVVALFVSPIIIWLLSLGFAVRVAVPVTKTVNLESPSQLGNLYIKSVNYKSKYLGLAHKTLVWGFVPLVVNIVIYMFWVW